VSRQFTDGEISATIGRIATEGGTLSRAVVRKRLGGGSSSRIDALLKEHRKNGAGASNGASVARREAEATLSVAASNSLNAQPEVPKPAVASGTKPEPSTDELKAENSEIIARLQSEIRVLKILLQSEQKARADDATRHLQTLEALQNEIETYRTTPR
jgi:hypothetical protein